MPTIPPGLSREILTLAPDEIQRFLMRSRREKDLENVDVRLDSQLREILGRANDFVPSKAGSILLDDPRAKFADGPARLTFIACFGDGAAKVLGTRYVHAHSYYFDHLENGSSMIDIWTVGASAVESVSSTSHRSVGG